MPIVYEPPQPFAPQLSAAYGAAEVSQQNLPTLARMYADRARLEAELAQSRARMQQDAGQVQAQINQRSALAGEDNAFRYAALGSGVSERGREFAQQLAQRQTEFLASREPSARDAYMAQQEQQQQRQRAELGAWLQQQEVGQAEQMRLQRMKNALSEIMDPGNGLMPHERQAFALKIKTGIDPIEERLKYQQAQQQKALTERTIEQADLLYQQQKRQAKVDAMTFEERTARDPDGSLWVQTKYGQWEQKKPEAGTDRLALQQQKIEAVRQQRGHLSFKEYNEAYNAAAREVDERKKAGESIPADRRTEYVASALEARGLGRNWQEHNARQMAEIRQAIGPEAFGAGGDFGGGGGGDWTAPGAPPPGSGVAPPSRQEVRVAVSQLQQRAAQLSLSRTLSPAEREQGTRAADQAIGLYQKVGGDLSKFTPEESALYDNTLVLQNALLKLSRMRAQGRRAGPLGSSGPAQPDRLAVELSRL